MGQPLILLVGALCSCEAVDACADGVPRCLDVAQRCGADERLELGEDLLHRIDAGSLTW